LTTPATTLMCHNLAHLEGVSSEENTRRRHEWARRRERALVDSGDSSEARGREVLEVSRPVDTFDVALFAGVDRPGLERGSLNKESLFKMLTTFEVLTDKRHGRCWSPTRYSENATSRGNAGVTDVSALVFDLDRVPPDPERLNGVCWIGLTTWSHTAAAPRWRVVIPLAKAVPIKQWPDLWRRGRAALCPEADPSCKDPSRQYYLPSHNGGLTARATRHDGPLLDPGTLPELPARQHPQLAQSRSTAKWRGALAGDQWRGDSYMANVIANLEGVAPGGRNDALNRAAWTLGRWVAAGALEQAEVEDALYAAAERNRLVAEDGDRQCWATIRSGLSAGLLQPIDLDADELG
jgi:hypothetical protein